MYTLNCFTKEVKKYNSIKYLKNVIERLNNNEGYCSLLGNHVVFNKYLTGTEKENRDRIIENKKSGIVSFNL